MAIITTAAIEHGDSNGGGMERKQQHYKYTPLLSSTQQRVAALIFLLVIMVVISSLDGGGIGGVLNATTTTTTPAGAVLKKTDRLDDIHPSVHDEDHGDDHAAKAVKNEEDDDIDNDIDITVSELLDTLRSARRDLDDRLQMNYGDYYTKMFYDENGVSRGRRVFISGRQVTAGTTTTTDPKNNDDMSISQARFQRKLQLKVLERILLLPRSSSLSAQNDSDPPLPKFVWATGGHSAAAGHGNLYSESNTAILSAAVTPAFQALGIQFEARNYAMGGTYILLYVCCDG
jgi:hypothetical protein